MAAPYFFMIQVTIDSATQVSIGTRSQNHVAVVRDCSMWSPPPRLRGSVAIAAGARSVWIGGWDDLPGRHAEQPVHRQR
jgi:hypothetical protein